MLLPRVLPRSLSAHRKACHSGSQHDLIISSQHDLIISMLLLLMTV